MAESMFNTNGSLSSTDPKVIQAAMRATGGQILPSSPSFKRALELAQLRDVQMQQGMAEGAQAVKSLKEYQAANPPTISGLPSNQVVTSDTGFKAVLDAQGNIVGTNVATAPVSASVGKFADERAAFNKGQGTMLERAALGPNIRDAFLKEYAKKAPVQAVAVEEVLPVQAVTAPAFTGLLGQPTFGTQPLPDDTPGNASRLARQIFSTPPAIPVPPSQAYVPYGTGENYTPVDAMGKPLSAEVQTEQLVAATPTVGEQSSMFEAAALRKQEMAKRTEREAALREGNAAAAKKLSDEITALRNKYLMERRKGGFERGISNLEGLST